MLNLCLKRNLKTISINNALILINCTFTFEIQNKNQETKTEKILEKLYSN